MLPTWPAVYVEAERLVRQSIWRKSAGPAMSSDMTVTAYALHVLLSLPQWVALGKPMMSLSRLSFAQTAVGPECCA